MTAVLNHAFNVKEDACIHLRYDVPLKREILYKIVTIKVHKFRNNVQLKYISKGYFQTYTFWEIIRVLHLLMLFNQVLCNTILHEADIHPRQTQSQPSPCVLINLTVILTPGAINQTTTLYISVITTVYMGLFVGIHGFSLLSLCDNYLYEWKRGQ